MFYIEKGRVFAKVGENFKEVKVTVDEVGTINIKDLKDVDDVKAEAVCTLEEVVARYSAKEEVVEEPKEQPKVEKRQSVEENEYVEVEKNSVNEWEVREENKQLKEKVAELTIENNQLQQNSAELERLQELFKMHQDTADYPKVGANVIASENSNWFSRFTIDKGSNDGIEVDMNVLSGAGLVGIVTEVGPNYSIVSSIIDDKNVSAMMLETFDKCIVSGDLKLIGEGVVKFEQLANNENEVKVGTQVVTSNISDKYLQGLLIGYVSEVTVDANNLTRSGYIIPATDFHELNEVLVITTTKKDLIDKKE